MTQHEATQALRQPARALVPLIAVAFVLVLFAVIVPSARHPVRLVRLVAANPPDSLPVPVAGVRASRLANTWGAERGGGRRHEGIDIFARRNTPIRSTTDGVVVSTDPNTLGGECIVVLGPGGHRHYYAHLERHGRFAAGDWVRAGDTIGYVGNTGNARTTPPHLHYGIYTPAGPVNPYPLLTRGRPTSVAKATASKKRSKAASRRKQSRRSPRTLKRTSAPGTQR